MLGISFYKSTKPNWVITKVVGGMLFFLSSLGITSAVFKESAGGIIGDLVARPLIALFDLYATLIFLVAALAISLLLMFDTRLVFSLPRFYLWGKKNEEKSDDTDNLIIAEMEDDTKAEETTDAPEETPNQAQNDLDTAEGLCTARKKNSGKRA